MKRLSFILLLICLTGVLFSQKTLYHKDIEASYRTAYDLFTKEKYGAAKKHFLDIVNQIDDVNNGLSSLSSYYAAVSALKLYNNDTEVLLNDFITTYPEHAMFNMAQFHLGSFYHGKKNYTKALKAFQEVDIRNLSADDLAAYHYKIGYCHFMRNDYEAASKSFYEIKDFETIYKAPANYYYAHIAYHNKNWETALQSFLKLKDDAHFGALVPYYIVHIYYMQGKYTELLEQAKPLLEKAEASKVPEISRIIGDAYFKQRNYKEALPYLKTYTASTKQLSKEDVYQVAYTHYQLEQYEASIEYFTKIISGNDSLTQNAHYILADAYLKTKQYPFARNAFLAAHKMDFDKKITQSALLNYAKLSYELSLNPYNDAVIALMTYIENYPQADDIDEANALLVNVFFATKNYKAAIESIEKIKFRNTELKGAYQKIAYMRGIELFNNKDYSSAIAHFNKSFSYILDPSIAAQSIFWKAESFYRLNRLDSASLHFNNFLLAQGAFLLPEYNLAHYNLAYVYFKQKRYEMAITAFRKFLAQSKGDDPKILNDARIRVADAYYMTKSYESAIEYYNIAIRQKATDIDYATYQKAVCFGVLGRFDDKANTLSELINNFPKSTYIVDAKFELGNTYLVIGQNENALKHFNNIIQQHGNSSYKVHSMLKVGLIYYNTNQNEKALEMLKRVVADYPGSNASKDALVSIRDIYVNLNQTEDFFVYVKNIPFANISAKEQDSITYMAAQNQYMTGDCINSLKGFNDYLDKFPNGVFVLEAQFYRAECLNRTGKQQDALNGYNFVISQHRTKFTESALLNAARISFHTKNYKEAIKFYSNLELIADVKNNIIEAQTGQMRSYFFLKDYDKCIETAQKVKAQEKIDDNLVQEAHLLTAKSHYELKKTSHAQAEFLAVTRMAENEMKAEAKYYLALIQYDLGNFKDSEKIIFEMINQMPSYNFWVAKCFILLADNLVAMGNNFQAKHTLQSIIDNYDEGLDLVQEAFEKLNKIIEAEKKANTKMQKPEEELIINISN